MRSRQEITPVTLRATVTIEKIRTAWNSGNVKELKKNITEVEKLLSEIKQVIKEDLWKNI